MKWPLALLLGALSGVWLPLLFPRIEADWLAWFALVPLFVLTVRAASTRQAFFSGWLSGVLFFAGSCYWIFDTVRQYGGLSTPVAALVFVLFLLLMGVYLGIFAGLGHWLTRGLRHPFFILPFLWTAVELLRTYTPMGGFPWNLLGYSQVDHAGFMLTVTVAGIYGAGFLIASVNALWASLLMRWLAASNPERARLGKTLLPTPNGGRGMAIVEVLASGLILAFASFPYHAPQTPPSTMQAILVQPNTSLDQQWTPASMQAFLGRMIKLSQPSATVAGGSHPDLVLWPEQPAPIYYRLDPAMQAAAAQVVAQTHATFVFGETSFPLGANGLPDQSRPRNSAQLIHADGAPGRRYDKIHLVPFGEYVPLPEWIKNLAGIGKLTSEVGDFIPGQHLVLFQDGNSRFATVICYESVFPNLVRDAVKDGAQWLVNISDDGWYGHSSAGWQGLAMARARAIENRRWLLRDTNDGITAVIDPYGRVVAKLPRYRAMALTAGFSPSNDLTFYTRVGDWPAWLCAILVVALLLARIARPLRRRVTETPLAEPV